MAALSVTIYTTTNERIVFETYVLTMDCKLRAHWSHVVGITKFQLALCITRNTRDEGCPLSCTERSSLSQNSCSFLGSPPLLVHVYFWSGQRKSDNIQNGMYNVFKVLRTCKSVQCVECRGMNIFKDWMSPGFWKIENWRITWDCATLFEDKFWGSRWICRG